MSVRSQPTSCTARTLALFVASLTLATAVSADDEVPRVLILGDSIYQQPVAEAAKELKDRVDVVFAALQPGEVRNTQNSIDNLDRLLGDGRWDVIYFNFGLGDLIHRAPNMKSFRVMAREAGGVRATGPGQYERNLHELVDRLQSTDAKLIWASTTPIRHSTSNVFELGSEIEYNAIAARVMLKHKVPVHDMYSHVRNLIDMDRPASHGADPFFFDRKPLHPPVVQAILSQLNPDEPAQ